MLPVLCDPNFKHYINQTILFNYLLHVKTSNAFKVEFNLYIPSMQGRPKGVTPKYSLSPLVPRLSELLGIQVYALPLNFSKLANAYHIYYVRGQFANPTKYF
jgi:hypothetical protein